MLKEFRADFHIHTVVSPCAEVEMIPPLIVREALEKKLDIIAITDHNTADNIEAVINAAKGTGLTVLSGMEVQTSEEIHVVCLFDHLTRMQEWEEYLQSFLSPLKNNPDVFGPQFVVDKDGNFLRYNERLLISSVNLTFDQVITQVQQRGGLCIPAHVNKPAYSVIANLGFIPDGLDIKGLEISRHISPPEFQRKYPFLKQYGLLSNSDAHRLEEIAQVCNVFTISEPTVEEICKALQNIAGRKVCVNYPE